MFSAKPNQSHLALTEFQKRYNSTQIITQNVDGLHQQAGSTTIDMHGNLSMVICQSCRTLKSRHLIQTMLSDLNPQIIPHLSRNENINPDGDVEVTFDYSEFQYPCCECNGI